MASSTELSKKSMIVEDGVVHATVVDKVSVDRIALMLFRAAAASRYVRKTDQTQEVDREIKNLIVFPFSAL